MRDVDLSATLDERPLERLEAGEWVGQTFTADHPGLRGVQVKLGVEPRSWEADIRLGLRRYPELEALAIVDTTLRDMEWGQLVELRFPPVEDSEGGEFYFYLQFPGADPHRYVAVWAYPRDVYPRGEMVLNGTPRTGDLHFRTVYRPPLGWAYDVETEAAEPGAYWLTGAVYGHRRVAQSFRCERDSLAAIEVLPTLLGTSWPGQIRLELKEAAESSVPLRVADTSGDSLRSNEFCRFTFAPVPYSVGKSFYFCVSAPWAPEKKAVSLWSHRTDVYPPGQLHINDEAVARDLVFRTYSLTAGQGASTRGDGAHLWVKPIPTPPLTPGHSLTQTFVAHETNLAGIELIPATYGAPYPGRAMARAWSFTRGEILFQKLVRPASMRDNVPYALSFPPVAVEAGESLGVEIRIEDAPEAANPLSFWRHPINALGTGVLTHDGAPIEGDLVMVSRYDVEFGTASHAVWSRLTQGKPGLLNTTAVYVAVLGLYAAGVLAAVLVLAVLARSALRKRVGP
jgi:hypothetical protein